MVSVSLPKQIRGSFGAKLLSVMIFLIAALTMLFHLFLAQLQRSSHNQYITNTGIAMARVLAESITLDVFAENLHGMKAPVSAIFNQDDVLGVAVFNTNKELLYSRQKEENGKESHSWQQMIQSIGPAHPPQLTETEEAFVFRHPVFYSVSAEREEDLYFSNPEQMLDAENIGYVVLALSVKEKQGHMQEALSHTVFSTIVFLLLGVLLISLVVRRITSPLSSLLRKVRASAGIQDHEDDFDLLSKTFDSQFNELRETFTVINVLKEKLEKTNRDLAADIAMRQQVEAALRKRDHILAAVNHATAKLLESNEWIPFIKEMVDELGHQWQVGAIRVMKHHVDADGDVIADLQHEWISEEVRASIDNLKRRNLSYSKLGFESWLECFQKGEMVSGNSDDMSPAVRSWLDDRGVKSIALAPIMVEKKCWGFMSSATFDRRVDWPEPELDALQAAARIIGAAVHREDMTRELEGKRAQLAHAGRLTAMGEMASGMAHEINQPLTVINLSADACASYFKKNEPESPEAEASEDIRLQVKKIARIIDNMRVFSGRASGGMKFLNPAYPVQDALAFFRVQFRAHKIDLQEDISEDLPEVKTEAQKFEQIVVNFLSNARYAVDKRAETEDGLVRKVVVRLFHRTLSREQITSFGGDPEFFYSGQAIVLEVQDNGTGMDDTVKSRCLEPFFTTKDVGEGTGLGLSVTHGLVRELGFYLAMESRPDEGSIFRVFIPVKQGEHHV